MSKKLTVAVVGATGAVGREMLKPLHDRQFPATEVRAFASARSAGTKVPFGDDELVVQELKEDVFEGIDIAIFSAGGSSAVCLYLGFGLIQSVYMHRPDANVPHLRSTRTLKMNFRKLNA